MSVINIHVESYSEIARNNGIKNHIRNASFEALILSYSINRDKVRTIDLVHTMDIPLEFIEAIMNPEVIKYCFDIEYTVKVLSKVLNMCITYHNWRSVNAMVSYMGLTNRYVIMKYNQKEEYKKLYELQKFFLSANIFKGKIYRNTSWEYPSKWDEYLNCFHYHIVLLVDIRDRLIGYMNGKRIWKLEEAHLNQTDKEVEVNIVKLRKNIMPGVIGGNNNMIELCNSKEVIDGLTHDEIIDILSGKIHDEAFMDMLQNHLDISSEGSASKLNNIYSQIGNWRFFNQVKFASKNGYLSQGGIEREDIIKLLMNKAITSAGAELGMFEYAEADHFIKDWLEEGIYNMELPFLNKESKKKDIKKEVYKAAVYCLLTGEEVNLGKISMHKREENLDVILPSGRTIRYLCCSVKPNIIQKLCIYHHKINHNKELLEEPLIQEELLKKIMKYITKDFMDEALMVLHRKNVEVAFAAFSYLLVELDTLPEENLDWTEFIPDWASDITLTGNIISKENAYEYI